MEHRVDEPPSAALDRLQAQSTAMGYTTDGRSDTSLTVSRPYRITAIHKAIIYVTALFTFGAALLVLLVLIQLKVRVTITAIAVPDGALLTLGGADQGVAEIAPWIERNLSPVAAIS